MQRPVRSGRKRHVLPDMQDDATAAMAVSFGNEEP